jgi:DNA-directed RNA polymerase II subunit RPB7
MFFVLTLKKYILVTPDLLGRKLFSHLFDVLKRTVEGTCSARYGYVVRVLKVDEHGEGKVKDGSGDVLFPLSFKALVFMPYQGEVLDAVVTEVMEIGFMASAGPLKLFVAQKNMLDEFEYDQQAGPFPIWKSKEDPTLVIEKNKVVRIKIIGFRVDANEMFAIGTTAEDFLGPLTNL